MNGMKSTSVAYDVVLSDAFITPTFSSILTDDDVFKNVRVVVRCSGHCCSEKKEREKKLNYLLIRQLLQLS